MKNTRDLDAKDFGSMLDGLRAGRTVRELCELYKLPLTSAPRVRRALYDHFGEDLVRNIIENAVHPSTKTKISKALEHAAEVLSSPTKVFVSREEKARRLAICNSCPFQIEGARCKFCGCKCDKLVAFAATKCEAKKWA